MNLWSSDMRIADQDEELSGRAGRGLDFGCGICAVAGVPFYKRLNEHFGSD